MSKIYIETTINYGSATKTSVLFTLENCKYLGESAYMCRVTLVFDTLIHKTQI